MTDPTTTPPPAAVPEPQGPRSLRPRATTSLGCGANEYLDLLPPGDRRNLVAVRVTGATDAGVRTSVTVQLPRALAHRLVGALVVALHGQPEAGR